MVMRQTLWQTLQVDKFKGANGSKNFRSRERKGRAISLQGAKVPGSETTGERIGQGRNGRGANWPGSYWPIRSWERMGPGVKRLGTVQQKAVNNMAASRPSRSEISQVESSHKIVD